jgi:hypothetical protein
MKYSFPQGEQPSVVMEFDSATSQFHYKISNQDMSIMANGLLPFNDDGKIAIKCRVYVRIPGSDSEGVTADESML